MKYKTQISKFLLFLLIGSSFFEFFGSTPVYSAGFHTWERYQAVPGKEYRLKYVIDLGLDFGWRTVYPSVDVNKDTGVITLTGSPYQNEVGSGYYGTGYTNEVIQRWTQRQSCSDWEGCYEEVYGASRYRSEQVDVYKKGNSTGQFVTSGDAYTYPNDRMHTDGFWYVYLGQNSPPSLTISTTGNKTINLKPGSNTFTISGKVTDPDNNRVMISASIDGKTKNVEVANTVTAKDWSLNWETNELSAGSYKSIIISVSDGIQTLRYNYNGTLIVDKTPLYYWDKYSVKDKKEFKLEYGKQDILYHREIWAYTNYNFDKETGRWELLGGTLVLPGMYTMHYIERGGVLNTLNYLGVLFNPDTRENEYAWQYSRNEVKEVSTGEKIKDSLLVENIIDLDGTYPDNGLHTDGYWYVKKATNNRVPILTINREDKIINANTTEDLKITGTVKDSDNDNVRVSATVAGITKTTTVSASSTAKNWTLQWKKNELSEGIYSDVSVIADDSKGGVVTSPYNKTILVDKTGPSAPGITTNTAEWTDKDVQVTIINGSDNLSGISKTEYRIGNGPWQIYTVPIIISTEGVTSVVARSIDGAGNNGAEASGETKIVKSPPTSPLITVQTGGWTPGPVAFNVSGSTGYGNFDYEYKINDGDYQQGSTGQVTEEGITQLTAKAVNVFGQESAEATSTITIDQTAPVIEVTPNGHDWSTDTIHAKVNVSDALSGVKANSVYYKVTNSTAAPSDWEVLNDSEIEITDEGKWYVHVKAMDNAGNTSEYTSEPFKIQFVPTAPVNVKSSNVQNNEVTVSWDLPTGSVYTDGYEYEVTNTVTGATYQVIYPENFIIDRGVSGGQEYEYIVKVKNHVGYDTAAGIKVLTKPDAPEELQVMKIDRDYSSALLVISPVIGADYYRVVVRDNNSGDVISDENVLGESYTINGLQAGTINSITVSGVNLQGEGPASSVSYLSLPDTPGGFSEVRIEETSIELQWNTVTSAVYLNLDRDKNSIYQGLDSLFKDTGLESGTEYDYRLEAVNDTGEGEYAYLNNLLTLPARPTGLKATASENSMSLEWNPVQGVDGYLLESKIGVSASVYGTQYTIDGLQPGTEYEFTITPKNRSGYGKSATISGYTLPNKPTGIRITNIEETSADIEFDPVKGADKYLVQIAGTEYEVSSPSLNVNGLSGSQLYDFTVWAGNSSGYGAAAAADLMTKPHAPSNLTVSALSADSITLGWDADSTAIGYRAMISGSDEEKDLQDHQATFKGLAPGTAYVMEVWTENRSGESLPAKMKVTTKTVPVDLDGVTIKVEHDQVIIDFNPVEHAKDHVLLDENGTEIWRGTEGPIVLSPITPGKEYDYSLVAENEQGVSSDPSEISFIGIPGAPEGIIIKVLQETSVTFDLSQADKTGAESILVYRDGKKIEEVSAADKTYTDKNLRPDTKYSYEFRAANESGVSKEAVQINAHTKRKEIPTNGAENETGGNDSSGSETGIKPGLDTDSNTGKEKNEENKKPDGNHNSGHENNNSSFDDIDRSFAKNEIMDLASRGIVKGTGVNKFEPERPITRMEFVSMIVRALGIEGSGQKPITFTDINLNKWYAAEFRAAWDNEVAHGFNAREFRPTALINREQASKMLGNVLQAKSDGGNTPFIDGANIAVWARSEVVGLTEKNLVTGYPDGSFRPKANLTRAESAALIYRTIMSVDNSNTE
ncbi:fibronectin type III domain-containing protein [Paenibacillus solani]|uniref:fibronectin type III domain-containing protein n=1 Tax=Paenibacillus solani TaxID=1705565 RepID=UPI003D2B235A